MKVRPLGALLFHAVGQRDTTKLTVALRSFMTAPKNPTSLFEEQDLLPEFAEGTSDPGNILSI
jgi:hypothetical protein